jgi:opacity protein-like surface antigen
VLILKFRPRSIAMLALAAAAAAVLPSTGAAAAGGTVRLGTIQYNSPGDDTGSNTSLNAEWVTVTNHATVSRHLGGWTLRDSSHHVFHFPSFTLRAGDSVRIHTGSGANGASNLHWGSGFYIWNNSGDKAILRNGSGQTIDTCSWSSSGAGSVHC